MPEDAGATITSIVIPTHNRPSELARCLASIAAARTPGPIEVMVVDDGGSVRLDPIIEPLRDSIGAVLIRKRQGGPGAARNLGVAEARGRYIVFTDDDCTFAEGAIASFAEGLAANPGAIVGGRTINALPGNPFASASQAIVDAVYAHNNPDPADARFFASNNMAAERSALLACGGFDERFTGASEDRELCDRWRHRGGRLVYRPEAIVYHAHDLRLGSFVRQHHAYGRGAYAYHRVRAARGSGRMRDDLRFHAELPRRLLTAARRVPVGTAARGAALAVVWQAVNASGWADAAITDATQRASQRLPHRRAGGSPLGPPSA